MWQHNYTTARTNCILIYSYYETCPIICWSEMNRNGTDLFHCLITSRSIVQGTEEQRKSSMSTRSAILAPCPGSSRLQNKRARSRLHRSISQTKIFCVVIVVHIRNCRQTRQEEVRQLRSNRRFMLNADLVDWIWSQSRMKQIWQEGGGKAKKLSFVIFAHITIERY